jgi:hypothetical protein
MVRSVATSRWTQAVLFITDLDVSGLLATAVFTHFYDFLVLIIWMLDPIMHLKRLFFASSRLDFLSANQRETRVKSTSKNLASSDLRFCFPFSL